MAGRRLAAVRGTVLDLPSSAWVALGADALSAAGSGLTLPFLVLYLHTVRGVSLGLAGVAASVMAFSGFVGNPLGGTMADRWGPRPVLATGWMVAGVGACCIAGVELPWQAVVAAAVSGLGLALAWPAQDTLLSRVVPARAHSDVFALRHTLQNVGFALGGLVSALVADTARPASFICLYVLDGASFFLAVPLLWLVRIPVLPGTVAAQPEGEKTVPGGYRVVVKDRLFLRLWVMTALLVAAGFAQFNSVFPLFVAGAGGGAGVVGLAYATNTITVTATQLLTLRLCRGRRRTAAIVTLSFLWAVSWTLVLVGTHMSGVGAVTVFGVMAVVFGLGETLFSPTVPALVNGIAPETLRGRYNGAAALALTAGFTIGPAAGGILLERSHAPWLLLGLMLSCALAALLAMSLQRRLPASVDLIDAPFGAAKDRNTQPVRPKR